MRRKNDTGKGLFLSFMFGLIFRYQWGVVALVLFILYLWLEIPYYIPLIGLLVWVGSALFSTLFMSWVVRSSNAPPPRQKNANPYSAKTEDIFGKRQK